MYTLVGKRSWYLPALALGLLLGSGCEETIDHHTDGGPVEDGAGAGEGLAGGEGGAGHTLSIYIKSDRRTVTFSDGLVGQTPRSYKMGLVRFELLRSATDKAPVTVFDHGNKPVLVDMLGTTLAGQADLESLTPGSYTHGRVLFSSCEFTVDATVHAGLVVPGEIKVVAALSDTTINGKPWKQGQTTFTFKSGSIQHTVPGLLPPLPSTGGGIVTQSGGKTYMTFTYPTPIIVAPPATRSVVGSMVYKVFESFRWQDETKPNYKKKVFDVDALGLTFEPVKNFGATGYGVEIN